MKALILAAGRGTRLSPLTDLRPKPMLPIQGVPMVERIMAAIYEQTGIADFVLVTGYRADVVRDHFGDGSAWGWHIEYALQESPLGVGHAVQCASAALREWPFLMTYGDIIVDPVNYAKIAKTNSRNSKASVGINWVDDPYRGAAVYVNEDLRISHIQEKPPRGTAKTHWNNAGLFLFDPLILDYTARLTMSERGECELPDAITAMIADGNCVNAVPIEGRWRDVGTLEDYTAINAEFGEDLP